MSSSRDAPLLSWQWTIYPAGHRDRRNLLVHALTVPLFALGSCALVAAPIARSWPLALGAVAMLGAMAAQGRTHRLEATPPVPFEGPRDAILRIVAEQWITFPRFVLSGGFSRSWRAARPQGPQGTATASASRSP